MKDTRKDDKLTDCLQWIILILGKQMVVGRDRDGGWIRLERSGVG